MNFVFIFNYEDKHGFQKFTKVCWMFYILMLKNSQTREVNFDKKKFTDENRHFYFKKCQFQWSAYVALIRFRMLQNIEIRQLLVHLHYLCGLSASLRANVLQIHPSPHYAWGQKYVITALFTFWLQLRRPEKMPHWHNYPTDRNKKYRHCNHKSLNMKSFCCFQSLCNII